MGWGRVEWDWHMGMSYLTSLNTQLFKNIAYVGSFGHILFNLIFNVNSNLAESSANCSACSYCELKHIVKILRRPESYFHCSKIILMMSDGGVSQPQNDFIRNVCTGTRYHLRRQPKRKKSQPRKEVVNCFHLHHHVEKCSLEKLRFYLWPYPLGCPTLHLFLNWATPY